VLGPTGCTVAGQAQQATQARLDHISPSRRPARHGWPSLCTTGPQLAGHPRRDPRVALPDPHLARATGQGAVSL